MRKFGLHIGLFSLPFWGLLAYLYLAPYSKEYGYHQIQKDCRMGDWIYERLFESELPVDIAFIGTSRTMCAIQDSLIEEVLASEGKRQAVVNLGVCRQGYSLHYLVLRDLLATRSPRIVFIEVGRGLTGHSHHHFPYLAETGDVFGTPLWLNQNYLDDIQTFTWNRWMYHREQWLGIQYEWPRVLSSKRFSFLLLDEEMHMPAGEGARLLEKRQDLTAAVPTGLRGWVYGIEQQYPKAYLRKMVEMVREAGAEPVFLYMKNFAEPAAKPQEAAFLKELALLWLAPDHIMMDSTLFFDGDHLNQAGSRALSTWLAGRLQAELGDAAGD